MAIVLERMKAEMRELAWLGTVPGRPGIDRPSFAGVDMAGRRTFMARCAEARLALARIEALTIIGAVAYEILLRRDARRAAAAG